MRSKIFQLIGICFQIGRKRRFVHGFHSLLTCPSKFNEQSSKGLQSRQKTGAQVHSAYKKQA